MLKVEHLSAGYGDITALWDISFTVNEGEIVGIMGPNGAGKTTTFKSIVGLVKPNSGRILLNDEEITHFHPSKVVSRRISYVPEGRKLFPFMTVEDNLLMGSYPKHAKKKRKELLGKVFALFPRLEERRKQEARTLSGGEQQMLAIGRALMSDPRILILDEPSLGLAPLIVQDLFRIIRELNEDGMTILISEQHLPMVLKIAHRGYVIEEGRIVLTGSSIELRQNEHIKTSYLGV